MTVIVAVDGLFLLEMKMCIGAAAISQAPTPAGMIMQKIAPTPVIKAGEEMASKVDPKNKLGKLRHGMSLAVQNSPLGLLKSS